MDEVKKMLDSLSVDPYLLYDAIVSSTDDYVYIIDMKENVALVSENMAADFELPGRVVPKLTEVWGAFVHPRDVKRYLDSLERMLKGETDEHNVEYQIKNRKGEYVWLHCRGLLKRDESGNPTVFAGAVTDLGDKGKVDHITGLFTQQECEKQVTRLLKQGNGGGFMLLGLDDFTRVNNLNDHIFGDMVLRQFAQDIQERLPQGGDLYRFDGDEFAIVLPGAAEDAMKDLYHKIHLYSNRRHDIGGESYFCTTSAGIVMLGRDADSYMDLVKCADSALDASKRRGKNTSTVFKSNLIEAELRSQKLVNLLQISVSSAMEGFNLAYQPLIRAGDSRIVGAEALLRWSCDSFGAVSPAEFVPLLENSGLIIPVGSWVLEEAVKTCKRWLPCCADFVMNINISYLQMLDPGFLPLVRSTLERHELEARHVVLEMTESYFVTDMEALKSTFQELRSMGISIAMDDFGTGYSSLGLLSQVPADEVKIDRAFITEINRNDFNRSFIGAVIQLCHSVGITVCVEGIETMDEFRTVVGLGADTVQGFQFSRPIPEESFRERYWADSLCGTGV